LSPRRGHNFLKVSCPAMSNQLFESELFGHEPGVTTAKDRTPVSVCRTIRAHYF
jgi:transcriptional regulator with GAF, ATPase, and Fis domain